MSEVFPTIQFDETRAMRYNYFKRLEIVRIVEAPADEEASIDSKYFGRMTFVGRHVLVVNQKTGRIEFGYDYDDFMRTHTRWEGIENGWYISTTVDAYQTDAEGDLLTERENVSQHIKAGDWIFRRYDGIWATRTENFSLLFDLESARPIPQEPQETEGR